ncbi:B-cell receptor-associated-like protein (macronuclear) [Tetrahymena thermophila SB210]|uniref:B-cell receptor-associated-like protein n=1 Tax=Tetrahymena thermophila (strain SB210) TaxID=312017 RepID=W7X7M6_TETTS|nr:B-cell receptor-associated-like protein [Tetrahymena thermophila SB210]EWS72408.1 B-cell receptor-associated-like protein [Tetrahymena thermophila SB210]|eukprot:XP_012655064.1 B-cell receptor-associated-like protein [Tetrahymena thermophila SB210]
MILTKLVYLIGIAQTFYFFLLLLVPFNVTIRKIVLSILFHNKFSDTFKKISFGFLVSVFVICLHSMTQINEFQNFLIQEQNSDHQDIHNIEQQTRVNFNKNVKYFYLTFYVLTVNLCIYGYTFYLKKLDELEDKIKTIKEVKKIQ